MIRLAAFLLILLPFTASADEAVVARAKTAMADRTGQAADEGALLVAYADSLRSHDIALATRCLELAGIASFRANNLDSALERWETGVAWASEAGAQKPESSLLNALAIGHTARGDVEAALPAYDRALELREALADTVGLTRTWGNLAQAYTNMGRTAEALSATLEGERWLAFVDNPRGRVGNAIRRCQLLVAMGRYDEAVQRGNQAVALADTVGDGQARGLAGMALGNALLDGGHAAAALPVLVDAAERLRAEGDLHAAPFVDQSVVQCLLMLNRPADALTMAESIMPTVEEAGHGPLLTVLQRNAGNALFALERRDEAEAILRAALETFEARREGLEDEKNRVSIFAASGELYASLARCALADGRNDDAFAIVERGRAAAFRDRLPGDATNREELQAVLARQNAALVLFNDPVVDPLVAFVLDGDGLRIVDLGTSAPLAEDAAAALRLLAAGESLEVCRPALLRLEESLAGPVLAVVDPSLTRCYLVPPSFLAGFPLGVLRDGQGRAWHDRHAVNYLPNATALVALDGRAAPSEGMLALADPETGDPVPARLPASPARSVQGVPLPAARDEILVVAHEAADRLVGSAATGEALRRALVGRLAVLHLATHAVVDPQDGGRSAVVLAGPDGVDAVTATEIAAASFAADLVVLSGCSTFGGHRVVGEGWFGLPRSFLAGGARSVVSTLWDVDDDGARRFVTAFYDALRHGLARDEALSRARAVCREAGLPPREWAAFVLTGVGSDGVRAVAASGGSRRPFLLAGAAVAGLLLLALVGLRSRR